MRCQQIPNDQEHFEDETPFKGERMKYPKFYKVKLKIMK